HSFRLPRSDRPLGCGRGNDEIPHRRLRRASREPRPRRRRGGAGGVRGTRDAPQGRARAGGVALRHHPDRLSALAVPAHAERLLRGPWGDHPDAVRVLRARGPVRPRQYDQARLHELQHQPAGDRPAPGDVRSAHHARPAGLGAARAALRREGVPHRDSPQRPARRSPEPWQARCRVRPRIARRQGLHGLRGRTHRTHRYALHEMTKPKPKAKGLGRGLDALLGNAEPDAPVLGASETTPQHLPLGRLQAGRYQPRTRMDEGSIQELAASIRQHGLMQPIVVRALPVEPGDGRPQRYEIIAGERRFRAAKLAELDEVPVVVREADDESALSLALIENIQREDLNPLEEAQGIRRLIDEFGYSHERAAEAIGRSRSATSNLLRLLNLAEPVQAMLMSGDLDMGHARALLAVDRAKQIMLAQE